MDVKIYYTEVYENILCIRSQGKQTQTNPISIATTVFLRKESLGLLITQEIATALRAGVLLCNLLQPHFVPVGCIKKSMQLPVIALLMVLFPVTAFQRYGAGLFQNIVYDAAIFKCPDFTVLVWEMIQHQICHILCYRPNGTLQHRAYLNLCHVSSRIAGNVRPSAKEPGKIALVSGNLSVQDIEVQENRLLMRWSRLVESMYQTKYSPAGPRDKLRWFGTVLDPAVCRIAHPRPMTQYTPGLGRAIYDINIRPGLSCSISISSTEIIIRKVLLHIFLSSAGNEQIPAHPIADLCWEST
ncbi:hypothetical protein ES703_51244 [subsurface metagenome]